MCKEKDTIHYSSDELALIMLVMWGALVRSLSARQQQTFLVDLEERITELQTNPNAIDPKKVPKITYLLQKIHDSLS